MSSLSEEVFVEIEAGRRRTKQRAVLTIVTLSGLITAIVLPFFSISGWPIASIYLVTYLAGGFTAVGSALSSLRRGSVNIDLLMVLAALAAAGVGAVTDGAILLFLFSLSGTLEGYAMGSTKRAVAALMQVRPDEANILQTDGTTVTVLVELLALGQVVVVRPGERLPIDGVIKSGAGAIDQSAVTGESIPVDKEPGDEVFAGTVNLNAVLTVIVTKLAGQSTIARMIKLVTEAQKKRSPSERFSDWFGQRYTIAVLGGSVAALAVFWLLGLPSEVALYKAATLLVVASPCAIVISVPAAVLSAIATAARGGVLFKDGSVLEKFGAITAIAFDKTGTLTEGKMHVTEVCSLSNQSSTEVLALVAALEADSNHPLAASVRKYAADLSVIVPLVTETKAIAGMGVIATIDEIQYWAGNRALLLQMIGASPAKLEHQLTQFEQAGQTTIIIGSKNRVIGVIAIADTVRASAANTIATFARQGVAHAVMVTGDTAAVAQAIARQVSLPVEAVFGSQLPEDKVTRLQELQIFGKTAFVGDGINDAVALATADVGIAIGVGGSDVAMEAADVALLSDDLHKLAGAHNLARQANNIIKQNLYFAVVVMSVMVLVTLFGNLPLPLGVIGHEGGTLLVVANGLRLLWMKV